MNATVALACLLALGQSGDIRHELGVRLRAMEAALAQTKDPETRSRAVPVVKDTTMLFFTGQFGKAGQLLDKARRILQGEPEWEPDRAWAESLSIQVQPRVVEAGASKWTVQVTSFYPAGNKPEAGKAQLRLTIPGGRTQSIPLNEVPTTATVETTCEPSSQEIRAEIVMADKVQARRNLTIYAHKDLKKVLASWKATLGKTEGKKDLGWETLNHLEDLVSSMASGKTLETDYPVERLIEQGSEIQKKLDEGKPWPAERLGPGEYWVALPESLAPRIVRIMVPKSGAPGPNGPKVQPCVLALHGAGGSENLFFDGYGVGEAVRQCQARGWILVSPRLAPGPTTLDQLSAILPIDPKTVFVVGHSMGAAQASAFAAGKPEKLKAAAYLGGGGRAGKGETFAALPAFVGVGQLDFALGSARTLHKALSNAGVKKAIFKEYPSVDHLAIVQIALPDVFAFFDETLATR